MIIYLIPGAGFSRLRRPAGALVKTMDFGQNPFKTKLESTIWVGNDQKEGVPDFGKSWQIGPDRPRSADWFFCPVLVFARAKKPRSYSSGEIGNG